MRHLVLAALGAVAALPITIAWPGTDAELYSLGISAAFGAGMLYARSSILERRTNEKFEQVRSELRTANVAAEHRDRTFEAHVADVAALRATVEGWKGRFEATVKAHEHRLATLEGLRVVSAT